MSAQTLEERITVIEAEIEALKRKPQGKVVDKSDDAVAWWERIRGDFKDDPACAEAMRLGREYRESLRPKDYEKI